MNSADTEPFVIDFESKSDVDLRTCGADKYSADASTGIWCLGYARPSDGEVKVWLPGDPLPDDLIEHVAGGGRIVAHNAAFEFLIWANVLRRDDPRWPPLRVAQLDCTLARALNMNLPGDLARCAKVLGLPVEKDMEGHRLMLQMSRRRKKTGDWWDDDAKLERLIAYCRTDVLTEIEVHKRLPPLTPREFATWLLDFEINRRGVYIDLPTVARARQAVADLTEAATAELQAITNNEVTSVNQVARLKAWALGRGTQLGSLQKGDVAEMIRKTDDSKVKRALQIRQDAGLSSVKKFAAMEHSACPDGRARGLYQYGGASTTLRWCLPAHTPVVVKTNGSVREVPITRVTRDMQVWDGEEWVSHSGVVYSGQRYLIEWDGVVASPDHHVFIDSNTKITLAEAKADGKEVWRGVLDIRGDIAVREKLHRSDWAERQPPVGGSYKQSRSAELPEPSVVQCDQEIRRESVPLLDTGARNHEGGGPSCGDTVDRYVRPAIQPVSWWGCGRLDGSQAVLGTDAKRPGGDGGVPPAAERRHPVKRATQGGEHPTASGRRALAQGEPAQGVGSVLAEHTNSQPREAASRSSFQQRLWSFVHQVRPCTACESGPWPGRKDAEALGNSKGPATGMPEHQARGQPPHGVVDDGGASQGHGEGACGHKAHGRSEGCTTHGCQEVVGGTPCGPGAISGGHGCPDREAEGSIGGEAVPTYDILNAGPRNRFMAWGRIVSNSGRRVQPQNMLRPAFDQTVVDEILDLVNDEDFGAEWVDFLFGSGIHAIASCCRAMFTAKPDHTLLAADFSNIEGRVIAWLAGEESKVQAFHDFDNGAGHDLYKLAASKIFNKPAHDIDKDARQIGKVAELACIAEGELVDTDSGLVPIQNVTTDMKVWDGEEYVRHEGVVYKGEKHVITYQGLTATRDHLVWVEGQHGPIPFGRAAACGSNLLRSFDGGAAVRDTVEARRVRVYDIVNCGQRHRFSVSGVIVHNCGFGGGLGAFASMARNYGLKIGPEGDLTEPQVEQIKDAWRAAHPNIVKFWRRLEMAAMSAIRSPGEVYHAGKHIKYRYVRIGGVPYLLCQLPSRRALSYPHARVDRDSGQIMYFGKNSYTNQIDWIKVYGGFFAENATQAVARDILVEAMFRVERSGFPIVMHTHDEIVSEVPSQSADLETLEALMAVQPEWCADLPIAVEGWRSARYRK